MSPPPPSPPLNPSRRHRTLQVDNGKGDNDQRRIRPELPARLKPHASTTNSTAIPSNAVFKTPALPPRLGTTAQVGVNNAQAWTAAPQHSSSVISNQSLTRARIDVILPHSAAPSVDHAEPKALHNMVGGTGGGSKGTAAGQQSAGANLPEDNTGDNIAKDLGCHDEAELELHQRVNKHVNAYLKKACGIPGGYRLYTERQAWNVLSTLEPLDLATNPEVFEPLETDQLAKFLNHRRKSMEEFQQSKMPMPPLPLLPSRTALNFRTDAQRENADLSIQWGLQGIVNRGKWTITQADLAMIKSELIHLQKARKRYDRFPPMLLLSPPPDEEIEVILSRVAIRKTTRYNHPASQGATASTEGNGFPALQPPKNSVKDFREMKKFYELLPVDDTPDEMETLLGPDKLKVTDVCKMSLSITQEGIGMVKEELQQVAARKRIGREQRMRNAVLSASWEESCGELPINLNVIHRLGRELALQKNPTTRFYNIRGLQ
ncbi:hypothetical protein QFC22_006207 [Naganishia vaughanmartiniae]|uniref:Uncharacterized protein n=1 Tax=Naganishia vaughanmartiniae TaxID=1424756 RepID=A0ACC2WLS3_9TREE|nr:hypothetical protein QFC22_006207 [Naganishia vaughanmartiniae]